jgi:anti-sigma factor RsiW
MRHEDTRIVPYLRNELSETEAQAVAAHLAGCVACRTTANDFRETLALLAESAPVAPAVHWGRYRAELREKVERRRLTGRTRWWPVSVALSGALAAVLIFLAVQDGPRDARTAELRAMEETVIGGKLELLRQYSLVERLDLLEDLDVIRHLDGLESTREG